MTYTSHVDTFTRDHLPPREQWPDMVFDLPELCYPEQLNCAVELLDRALERGWGERTAILTPAGLRWTFAALTAPATRIARVLVEDLDLVPGNRVLLRGPNSPMMAACWFAVMKAGGVAVATMPLLRAKELTEIVAKAQVTHALCDARLAAELDAARAICPTLATVAFFETTAPDGIEARAAAKPSHFENVTTAAEDTALIAFTSGTTGRPKGTMHFHRDVMASCDCWPLSTLRARSDDIFTGSPPLAFTFGLGGLLLFPLHAGAATLLLEKPSTDALLDAIAAGSASGVAFSISTVDAPTDIGNSSRPPRPNVNASGGLPMNTSSGAGLSTWRGQQAQAAIRSRWKCIVPLGWPVVPEVNAITQVSSAAVRTVSNVAGFVAATVSSASGAPPPNCITRTNVGQSGRASASSSARRTSHSACVTWAFTTICVNSLARSSGMLPTAMPPALTTANQQAASIGEFGLRSSTRLPGTRPMSSTSTRAMRFACACRSA